MPISTLEYIPYTYLIGWSEQDLWYYGVEYAQNKRRTSNPCNLWTSYFTSSKLVHDTIDRYGQPDVVQVRRKFQCPKHAIHWESSVLRRMGVTKSDRWINRNHSVHNFDVRGKNNPNFGKTMSAETRIKISEKAKGRPVSTDTIEKLRLASTGRCHSSATRQRMSEAQKLRAVNTVTHPLLSEEAKRAASERRKGKTFEELFGERAAAIKNKMSSSRKGQPAWNTGIKAPEITKERMSAAQKGKPRPYMKGMVSAVDPEGNVIRVSKEEFDSRPDLVGIMSTDGKLRRSLKSLPTLQ